MEYAIIIIDNDLALVREDLGNTHATHRVKILNAEEFARVMSFYQERYYIVRTLKYVRYTYKLYVFSVEQFKKYYLVKEV